MILLYMENHSYLYECENLCRVFFPEHSVRQAGAAEKSFEGEVIKVCSRIEKNENDTALFASVRFGEKYSEKLSALQNGDVFYDEKIERELMKTLFCALSEFTEYRPPWGILTGVRPAKLMHAVSKQLGGEENAVKYFENELFVSSSKAELARRVAEKENRIIELSEPKSFSLYISIPFCPTRCSYCSFVSSSVKSAGKLIDSYVELLKKEINETGKIVSSLGLRLETVYFGGGTPTTLEAVGLGELISEIENSFNTQTVREYTVEAGRPDTITQEKLELLCNGFPKRISINPQTMNDSVLKSIGRAHTVAQFEEMFRLARQVGMKNINTDIIAGLEGDTLESFSETVERLCNMSPESITVHTLALKRSSHMAEKNQSLAERGVTVQKMLAGAEKTLQSNGYEPYYMYRQSKMAGNLENVGWCKPGFECMYNVYMMDETHTVLACGAGAVTKLRVPGENKLERIFNYKYPFEYISGFDTLTERKKRISEFYSEFLRR